jgi:hypothetical protein
MQLKHFYTEFFKWAQSKWVYSNFKISWNTPIPDSDILCVGWFWIQWEHG